MRVYFVRAPIECKIMATCRIFAGATVTNISDKALPPRRHRPARPVPSHPVSVPCRGIPYLSYIDLPRTDTPPVSYFRSPRAHTPRDDINSRIPARRRTGHRRENCTWLRVFPSRAKTADALSRVARIDSRLEIRGSLRYRGYFCVTSGVRCH